MKMGNYKCLCVIHFLVLTYGQAALAEGNQPPNPGEFAKLVANLMVHAG